MSLEEIIKLKLSRLSSIPEEFISSLDKTEKEYFQELLKLISRLDTKDGRLIVSKNSLDIVSQIESQMKDLFLDTDYKAQVKKFIQEFDSQARINDKYFEQAFPGASVPEIAKDILSKKKQSVATLLLGDSLDAEFINPIKAQLNLAVQSGASFSETLDQLQKIITGDKDVDSKIKQYSKQIAFDSFAISDRAYTKVVADKLGAEWFKWSGNVIPTSRVICINNHNKFFHKKEIEAMADQDWPGKIDGTNSETIFATAGGHNCRHSILPVSLFAVPKEVIQRNIDNGNFVPSENEKDLLGVGGN